MPTDEHSNNSSATAGAEVTETMGVIGNESPDVTGSAFLEGVRRVLMAGIGAIVLAQEEVEEFVSRLVERGELAETDGRRLVNDVMEKRDDIVRLPQATSDELEKRVEDTLNRLNVPTKDEISALSLQIEALSHKVDALNELESSV